MLNLTRLPIISVVICTYNREKYIGLALKSLVHQTLDKKSYQIVIVNNNCTDNTDAICRQFVASNPNLLITYCIEKKQGLCFARNRGIDESISDIITYIDDDAVAAPDFLAQIVAFLAAQPHAIGVGGRVLPIYEQGEPAWMNPYLEGMVSKRDLGDKVLLFKGGRGNYPVGCNMTYRKDTLQKAGRFNEQLLARADDKDIFFRVRALSNQIYYLPTATVQHHIDAERVSHKGFVRLSRKTGSEERIRAKAEGVYAKTVLSELYKFVASIGLGVMYLIKGQPQKAWYVVLCKWYTLLGLADFKL